MDQVLHVPDAATKAEYEAQREAQRAAVDGKEAPAITVCTLHATAETTVSTGGYANVVTLGAFKTIKLDASFGAIHAGDLLTTSTNPGYAMKVSDKVAAIGAIIGKALGDLASGTGAIPVLVMPK